MFRQSWKIIKHICMMTAVLSMLIGGMGVAPVQASQAVAAPKPEGGTPSQYVRGTSVLVNSVSAGGGHTCGIRSDGTLACWGLNVDGQTTPPAGTFAQVSAGGRHTCGIRSDGDRKSVV